MILKLISIFHLDNLFIISINLIFAFFQMYFIKEINSLDNYSVYTKFMNSFNEINRFNLDIESLFIQLRYQIIND